MSEISELIGEKLNGQTLSSIMWSLEKKIGSRITDLEQVGRLVNRELFGQVFSGKNGDKYRFAGIERANSKKDIGDLTEVTWSIWEVFFIDQDGRLLTAIDDKEHDIELVLTEE